VNSYFFKENKYSKWYFSIINLAKTKKRKKNKNLYFEEHHIIPVSLGGDNKKENRILLTAKEHFICHVLLCKFTKKESKIKMFYALRAFQMKGQSQIRYFNSRLYDRVRLEHNAQIKQNFSGKNNPMFGKKSPTKGHKWYNDGVQEYKVDPIFKNKNWNNGRLHPTTKNFSKV
jgi:hypothetical protein